jgi:ribosomal protein L11 methyltransferase
MWTVIQLNVAQDALAQVEALLQLAGAAAVSLADAGDTALFEPAPGDIPMWQQVRVEALFEQPIQAQRLGTTLSRALGTPIAVREQPLADEDWQNAWRAHWQPLRFGERLTVVPADDPLSHPDDVVVRLSPGLAFGTGQHPTTALCLEWLAAADLRGRSVCDYGTGSGLLAIAAARLGAEHVYALDIDAQALGACDRNARANGVREQLTIGEPAALADKTVDILVANILSETLKNLAAPLASRVKQPGKLILSGILVAQAAGVTEAYEPWFSFLAPVERDGWVRLAARTRPSAN